MIRTVSIVVVLVALLVLPGPGDALAQLLGDRSGQAAGASGGWMPSFMQDFIGWIVVRRRPVEE